MQSALLRFDQIDPDYEEVYLAMGYPPATAPQFVREAVAEVLGELRTHCKPRYGYALHPAGPVGQGRMTIGGVEFAPGAIIASYQAQATQFAVFVATAGEEFNRWVAEQHLRGDVFRDYVIDLIGSEIAEATARVLHTRLAAQAELAGEHIGNPYSPGYCGWHVSEQQLLFTLLPHEPCGIRLSDSSLMSPIKSVSGIVPIGPEVRKQPYRCAICTHKTCYKKQKR